MRIISEFKDYYDSLGNYSKDERPIFKRAYSSIHLGNMFHNGQTPELVALRKAVEPLIELIGTMPFGQPKFYKIGLLAFCGKVYPIYEDKIATADSLIWQVRNHDLSSSVYGRLYGWNKKALARFENSKRDATSRNPDRRFIRDNIEHFFANFKTEIGDEVFVKVGTPTFLLKSHHYQWITTFKEDATLIKNPCLHDLDFHKVLDAYNCYQEIDQYLGNNMAEVVSIEPKGITDKLKAEAHGFNDLSFRKTKEEDSKARKRKAKEEAKRLKKEQELKSKSDWEKDFE